MLDTTPGHPLDPHPLDRRRFPSSQVRVGSRQTEKVAPDTGAFPLRGARASHPGANPDSHVRRDQLILDPASRTCNNSIAGIWPNAVLNSR